jgi:hypothetical protein
MRVVRATQCPSSGRESSIDDVLCTLIFYSKESEREGRRYPFVLTRRSHEDDAQRAACAMAGIPMPSSGMGSGIQFREEKTFRKVREDSPLFVEL